MAEGRVAEDDTGMDEAARVVLHRYREARLYGLTRLEARLWAESDADVGELRRLKALGCGPAVAAKILL